MRALRRARASKWRIDRKSKMNVKRLFFVLALLGALIPIAILYMGIERINWSYAIASQDLHIFLSSPIAWVVLTWLFISGFALTVFAVYEAMVRRDYYLLLVIPMVMIFSIGVALPFYLFLRSPNRDQ